MCLAALLFSFSGAAAGPEQVNLTFLDKWGYHGVDGWGLYPRDGEFSWFGFILNNPTENEYTVSLPIDVDVAHQTMHPIANTFYRVLTPGSNYYPGDDLVNHYFTGSFRLPPNSTYSIFMDILDFKKYSGQWDTNVFFSVDITDAENKKTIDIKNGVLAYDAYQTLPKSRDIVIAPSPLFSTIKLCRDYDPASGKIYIAYDIRNNSTNSIPIQLPMTVSINEEDKTQILTTTSCFSKADPCEFTNGFYTLGAKRTVRVTAQADAPAAMQNDFSVSTSFRYQYGIDLYKGFYIGSSEDSCITLPTQDPTAAVFPTPVITATPAVPAEPTVTSTTEATVTAVPTESAALASAGFCRTYDASTKTVKLSYSIQNRTTGNLPVELATSIVAEGDQNTSAIRNITCSNKDGSCTSRISNGFIDMAPYEIITISGEAVLASPPVKADFYIRTSLRYRFANDMVPLLIGYTSSACSGSPATPVIPAPSVNTPLTKVNFCKIQNQNSQKSAFEYTLRNDGTTSLSIELASTMSVQGMQQTLPIKYTDCTISGRSCMRNITNGYLTLDAGNAVKLTGEIGISASKSSSLWLRTSLRYIQNDQTLIPFALGQTGDYCSAGQQPKTSDNTTGADISKSGADLMNENNSGIDLYYIGEASGTSVIPSFPVK